jgi:integrase
MSLKNGIIWSPQKLGFYWIDNCLVYRGHSNSWHRKPFTDFACISKTYWRPVFEKLDIAYRNPYQMRHTFASMMISNGEDILWVSKMLGHTTSAMTLTMYARYVENKDKKRGAFLIAS